MISQLTLFLSRKSSSTQKKHLKSAKILVNRNEKSNLFLGMTSWTCCNLIGCWGMANLFSSNLGFTIVCSPELEKARSQNKGGPTQHIKFCMSLQTSFPKAQQSSLAIQ